MTRAIDKLRAQAIGKLRVTVNAKTLVEVIDHEQELNRIAVQMTNVIFNSTQGGASDWETAKEHLIELMHKHDSLRTRTP